MKGRNSAWTVGTSNVREAAAAMGVVGHEKHGPSTPGAVGGHVSPAKSMAKVQGGTKKQVPTKGSASIKGGGQAGGKLQGGTKPLVPGKAHRIRGGGQMGAKLQGGTKTQVPVKSKGKAIPMTISKNLRNSSLGGVKAVRGALPPAGNHVGPRA